MGRGVAKTKIEGVCQRGVKKTKCGRGRGKNVFFLGGGGYITQKSRWGEVSGTLGSNIKWNSPFQENQRTRAVVEIFK